MSCVASLRSRMATEVPSCHYFKRCRLGIFETHLSRSYDVKTTFGASPVNASLNEIGNEGTRRIEISVGALDQRDPATASGAGPTRPAGFPRTLARARALRESAGHEPQIATTKMVDSVQCGYPRWAPATCGLWRTRGGVLLIPSHRLERAAVDAVSDEDFAFFRNGWV